MNKKTEIPISEEDLKFIVKDEFDKIVGLAKYNSFCSNCHEKHKVEMIEYTLRLNHLNDLIVEGKCKSCGKRIGRYIEIGEHKKFRIRTEIIKESKINKN